MVSPIFPGVGTQSRIADVIQRDNEFRLRQEALNRQSGQALLETGVQTGFGVNQAIQQVLDRQAQEREAEATRTAALTQIGRTAEERRLTEGEIARLRSAEAKRVEGVELTERERLEARRAPGGAEFFETIRGEREARETAESIARIRSQAQIEGGPLAAARFQAEDRPARLEAEAQSARAQAQLAQEFARDPITFIEDQIKVVLLTIQRLNEGRSFNQAQDVRDREIPKLLDLYELFRRGDPTAAEKAPTLELLRQQRIIEEPAEPGELRFMGPAQPQEMIDAAERAARLRQQAPFQRADPRFRRFGSPGAF